MAIGLAGTIIAAGAAAKWALPAARRSVIDWLNNPDANRTDISDRELRICADFTGALMGLRLAAPQLDVLARRLERIAAKEARWRTQYTAVAAFAESRAKELDPAASGFSKASDEVRERMVMETMHEPDHSRAVRIRIIASSNGRAMWRIRNGVAVHLRRVYELSPVPWMHWGYKGWPGAPADRLDYTRPGPTTA
jgi:hypothetical protein